MRKNLDQKEIMRHQTGFKNINKITRDNKGKSI